MPPERLCSLTQTLLAIVVNGAWIYLVLQHYNSEGINRSGRSIASGQTTCPVLLEWDWGREQEGVHIFHVHPHPSLGCNAQSSFVCLWVVWRLQWYSTHFRSLTAWSKATFHGRFILREGINNCQETLRWFVNSEKVRWCKDFLNIPTWGSISIQVEIHWEAVSTHLDSSQRQWNKREIQLL